MTGCDTSKSQVDWIAWSPVQLKQHLRQIECVWYIVGGWALDLWHERETRDHEDLEFCILRPDFQTFGTALRDFDFYAAEAGKLSKLDAANVSPETGDQFWALNPKDKTWSFDMMIEPGSVDRWVYKRDRNFSAPRSDMMCHSKDGIAYLDPAAVLLFKAKHLREKDARDFELALPQLSASQRVWLRDALTVFHPNHSWTTRL